MSRCTQIWAAWAAVMIGSLAAGSAKAAIITWLPAHALTPHHWSGETGAPAEPQTAPGRRKPNTIRLARTTVHRSAQRTMGGLSKSRLTVSHVAANSPGGANLTRQRVGAASPTGHLSHPYALASRPSQPIVGSAGVHPGSALGLGELIGTQINKSLGGIGDPPLALPPVSQPGASDALLVSGTGHDPMGSNLFGQTTAMGSYPPGTVLGANGLGAPTIPSAAISMLQAGLTQPSADSLTSDGPVANPEPASALIWLGVSALAALFAARPRRTA